MKKNAKILALIAFTIVVCNYLEAQVYTLPIHNQNEFLDKTISLYTRYSYGLPMEVTVSRKNDVSRYLLMRVEMGFTQKRIYFDNHFIFEDSSSVLMITPDHDPNHDYPNKLFKSGYSQLIGSYISVNPEWVFLTLGENVYFTTGPLVDIRVESKHKRKWFEGAEKMKDKLKGNDLLKLSNFNLGWEASFYAFGIGLSYQYMFNDFFQNDWGVDLKYHSFGIMIGF